MFNPLISDISKLKNDELELKINELMKKYFIASRFGQGAVCQQISIILETYKLEQSRRHQETIKKTIKNNNLDDYINIDH